MVKASRIIVVVAALVAACHLRSNVFVAPPSRKAMAVASATGFMACLASVAPAFADEIDDAAEKLSERAYPFLREISWTSSTYTTMPEVKDPIKLLKIIDKMLIMGAAMDPNALKDGVLAHSKAIGSMGRSGVCAEKDFTGILKAIGHMIASAGSRKSMEVYAAGLEIVPGGPIGGSMVPKYLMSTVNSEDAQSAYGGLLEFAKVVETAADAQR